MCQLIYIDTNSKLINSHLLSSLLLTDTFISHQDGFGVFNGDTLFKDVDCPHIFPELGNWILENTTKKSILAHVRQASFGTKIDIKNNHPFESKNLILAHNGTLAIKIDKKVKNHDTLFKDIIDSAIFLSYLELSYAKSKNLVTSLNETMENFTGKFAFLIFEKSTKNYYAIRGDSADLYISTVVTTENEFIGYVINTELKSLLAGLNIATSALQISKINVVYQDPLKLEDNSIFLLETTGPKK